MSHQSYKHKASSTNGTHCPPVMRPQLTSSPVSKELYHHHPGSPGKQSNTFARHDLAGCTSRLCTSPAKRFRKALFRSQASASPLQSPLLPAAMASLLSPRRKSRLRGAAFGSQPLAPPLLASSLDGDGEDTRRCRSTHISGALLLSVTSMTMV